MKIKFGALVTDGRGKIGGHVASKSASGAYLRTKVTPVNRQTSYQMVARGRLALFAQSWRSLTAAQRSAWDAAVVNFAKTDVFGDVRNPSGANLYSRLNINLARIGSSPILLPPAPVAVASPDTIALEAAVNGPYLNLIWTGSNPSATCTWVWRISRQVSAGIRFGKNLLVDMDLLTDGTTSPIDDWGTYQPRFGDLVVGARIFAEVIAIDVNTGINGSPLITSCIVIDSP